MNNKLINQIDEYIVNSIKEGNKDIIDTFLESNGYDILEIERISNKSYKQLSFNLKGIINSQKDEILLEKAITSFQEAISNNIEKPVNFLKSLIQTKKYALHYRNLENLSKKEIEEIIKDHNLLEILEKLENDEK